MSDTIQSRIQERLNAGVTEDAVRKEFLSYYGVSIDTVYGDTPIDDMEEMRKVSREKAASTLGKDLESVGFTDLAITDKAQMRREEDKGRGVARAAPPIAPPAIVPDAGMGMAGNFDPDRAAREEYNPAGEPRYRRAELTFDPIGSNIGLVQSLGDMTLAGIDKAVISGEQETDKRKKMDWQEAAQVDSAEYLASPFLLLTKLAGLRYVELDKESTISAGRRDGKDLLEGVAASTINALDDVRELDVDAFTARPLSTATWMVPALRGATRLAPAVVGKTVSGAVSGAVGKTVGKAAKAAGGLADRVAEGAYKVGSKAIPGTPATPAVIKAITGVIESSLGAFMTAEGRSSVVRTITDGLHQADPRATALMQQIVQDPQNAAASIKADFGRLQHRAEQVDKAPEITPDIEAAAREVVIPPAADDVSRAAGVVEGIDASARAAAESVPFTRADGTTVRFKADKLDDTLTSLESVIDNPASSKQQIKEAERAKRTILKRFDKEESAKRRVAPEPIEAGDKPVVANGIVYAAEDVAEAIADLEFAIENAPVAEARQAKLDLDALVEAAEGAGRTKAESMARSTLAEQATAASPLAIAAQSRLQDLGVDLPPDIRSGTRGTGTPIEAIPESSSVFSHTPEPAPASVESALPIGLWRGKLREVAGDVIDDIRKQVDELDPDLAARLKETGRTVDDEILTAAASAMAGEIHSLLRNKTFRDKVAAKTAESMNVANPKQFAKQLSDEVDKALGKSFAGEAPLNSVLLDEGIRKEWGAAIDSVMGATKSKEMIRGAVSTVSENLARELEKTALTKGIAGEAARAGDGAGTILAQIENGDLPSQILPASMNPKEIAASMIAASPGNAKVAAVAAVIAGYEKLDGALLGTDGWAKPSFKSSLETHARARNAFFQDDIMSNIIRAQKLGYVPRNVKSIINNYASNEAMQWWSWANPVAPMVRLGRARKYQQFLEGKLTGSEAQMMKSISRTGIVETNRLAADIGAVGSMSDFGATIPGVKQINKVLERGFGLGDQIFKIDEMITGYRALDGHLKKLRPGNHLTVDQGSKRIRFERGADGYLTYTDATAPKKMAPKNIGGEALSDLIARITTGAADRKFINYSRIPGGLQKLKASPFRGLGSGFATWMAGAVDVPGLKKGLLHASIAEPLGIVTNDRGILFNLALHDAGVAARRGVMLGIAGNQQTGADAQEIGKLFSWSANEARPLLALMVDPDTAASVDLKGVDYLGPTKLMTRVGVSMGLAMASALKTGGGGTAEALIDRVTSEGADPEKWSHYTRMLYRDSTGQIGSASDILDLIAMSGSTLKDVIDKIKDTKKANKVITVAEVMSIAMAPFLGSSVATLFTGGAAAGVEYAGTGTISKNRARTLGDEPTDSQSFMRWYIRHMTGKGWDERALEGSGPDKAYSPFWKYQQKWLTSLQVKKMDSDGMAMILLGENQNAAVPGSGEAAIREGEKMVDDAIELESAVKEIMVEQHDLYLQRADRMGITPLPMPAEPVDEDEGEPLFVEPEPGAEEE